MHLLALTSDSAQAWAILIAAIGAAAASCIAAYFTYTNHQASKLPSNGVTPGAAAENTAVNLGTLVHMVAEEFGKRAAVPTPRQTQAQAPGATLNSPPPPPESIQPPPATPPAQ